MTVLGRRQRSEVGDLGVGVLQCAVWVAGECAPPLGHPEPAPLREGLGGQGSQAQCTPTPTTREGCPPALSCQQRGLTFRLTFMFRVKETAKLPLSENSFQPPRMRVGNPGQSSRRPPPCRASAPVYTSHPLPPHPSVCVRQTPGKQPLFFYTLSQLPQPHSTSHPTFCKYVKRKKMQTLESWPECLPPAVTLTM